MNNLDQFQMTDDETKGMYECEESYWNAYLKRIPKELIYTDACSEDGQVVFYCEKGTGKLIMGKVCGIYYLFNLLDKEKINPTKPVKHIVIHDKEVSNYIAKEFYKKNMTELFTSVSMERRKELTEKMKEYYAIFSSQFTLPEKFAEALLNYARFLGKTEEEKEFCKFILDMELSK